MFFAICLLSCCLLLYSRISLLFLTIRVCYPVVCYYMTALSCCLLLYDCFIQLFVAKTVELAASGLDVKSFTRQSRPRGGGIATVYKSTFGSNITFKTNFDFTHTPFEVVQASITLQHNTLHFFCLDRPPPNRQSNLTDYVY